MTPLPELARQHPALPEDLALRVEPGRRIVTMGRSGIRRWR
jgi:hypothetical protein